MRQRFVMPQDVSSLIGFATHYGTNQLGDNLRIIVVRAESIAVTLQCRLKASRADLLSQLFLRKYVAWPTAVQYTSSSFNPMRYSTKLLEHSFRPRLRL